MTLTLNFQGQIWNSLYLDQKWSGSHKTKSRHYELTLSLKCYHQICPWLWPWPWIFKVKNGIYYISAKNGPIATKQKANISIELWTSNMTIGFDLDHDIDLVFSRSNTEFIISWRKMVRLPRNEKQTSRLNYKLQMWPSDMNLAVTLTLNFQCQMRYLLYIGKKMVRLPQNKKQTVTSIELYASNVTITFDLGQDLDYEFSTSNLEFAISQPKVVWSPQNEK